VLRNLKEGVLYAQPSTEDERAEVAAACQLGMRLQLPMALDRMSNEVERAYAALPERLYVIDPDGAIRWRSGPGPFGFDVAAWERAIEAELERLKQRG
jgi:type I thyroxine 5'-deiodinase